MQQGFFKKHFTNWVLLFFGVLMLIPILLFRKDAIRSLKTFSFITGQVDDFSDGSYQKKKPGRFGGRVIRYGFKLRLEGKIHVFNINDLTKKEADRLKKS